MVHLCCKRMEIKNWTYFIPQAYVRWRISVYLHIQHWESWCNDLQNAVDDMQVYSDAVISTESSRCTSLWKKVVAVGVNLLFQSLSRPTGVQSSGGDAWLVGKERRLIKSDPLVRCSLITFSPAIRQSSLWGSGSNLRLVTLSRSTWVTLLMRERPGGSSHRWAGKSESFWQTEGNTKKVRALTESEELCTSRKSGVSRSSRSIFFYCFWCSVTESQQTWYSF